MLSRGGFRWIGTREGVNYWLDVDTALLKMLYTNNVYPNHEVNSYEKEKYKPDLDHLENMMYTFQVAFIWRCTREGFKYWNHVRHILDRMISEF